MAIKQSDKDILSEGYKEMLELLPTIREAYRNVSKTVMGQLGKGLNLNETELETKIKDSKTKFLSTSKGLSDEAKDSYAYKSLVEMTDGFANILNVKKQINTKPFSEYFQEYIDIAIDKIHEAKAFLDKIFDFDEQIEQKAKNKEKIDGSSIEVRGNKAFGHTNTGYDMMTSFMSLDTDDKNPKIKENKTEQKTKVSQEKISVDPDGLVTGSTHVKEKIAVSHTDYSLKGMNASQKKALERFGGAFAPTVQIARPTQKHTQSRTQQMSMSN